MENFLRKYGWALTLALIGVGALLLALTANNFLASQLAPYTVPEMPTLEKPAPRPVLTANSKNWDRTLSRLCLFGCPDSEPVEECPGGCAPGEQCQNGQCVPEAGGGVDSDVPSLSDLDMQLMGSMVSKDPEFSMALIRDASTDATLIMGVGDFIQDQIEIVEIRRDRIMLDSGGRVEYLLMNQTLGGAPSAMTTSTLRQPSQASKPPASKSAKTPRASATNEAVKKIDDTHFEVKREAINEKLKDRKAIASQGRIAPNFKNGKRDGLKLVGLSPDSVYSQLGIQSGDVLQSFNGKQINTTQQAMELLDQLKTSGNVTVEIERRGKKKRMQYKID